MKSENVFTEISQEVNSSAYMYDFIECVLIRVKYPKKNDHGEVKKVRMKEKKLLNLTTSPHRSNTTVSDQWHQPRKALVRNIISVRIPPTNQNDRYLTMFHPSPSEVCMLLPHRWFRKLPLKN